MRLRGIYTSVMTTVPKHRIVLGALLAQYKRPVMVELGVASGETSEYLLRRHSGLFIYMVDNWRCPPHRVNRRAWGQQTYDRGFDNAIYRTKFASTRREVIRKDTVEAANLDRIKEVDVVFVDADHTYEGVLADIRAWWPKVKVGGVMCGHDIDSPRDLNGTWGVRRAVEEYFRHPPQVTDNVWAVVNV